jgi:hypothetical protein
MAKKRPRSEYPPRVCGHCGKEFRLKVDGEKSNWHRRKFCSPDCQKSAPRRRVREAQKPARRERRKSFQPVHIPPVSTSKSLSESLSDAIGLHPDFGLILAEDPVLLRTTENTWYNFSYIGKPIRLT